VAGAQPGDSLFLHYSGHGGQKRDLDGDEEDGMDETLCPCDYQKAGVILDDDMFRILVQPLPVGCRLTAIFDACHSGSALDLPHMYDSMGHTIVESPRRDRKGRILPPPPAKTAQGDVIMFSGCADHQTSADAVIQGRAAGAMSSALIHVFTHCENPNHISFADILRLMRQYLEKNRYTQVPQLSSSREMDMKYPWII
jgi:metacaspase-1